MSSALSFDNLNNHKTLYVCDDLGLYQIAKSEEILATARYVADELFADRIACDNPVKVKQFLIGKLAGMEHEVVAFIFLDSQYRLIDYQELFHGTINQSSVYPREVVKVALRLNAAAVIMAHNHPSGNPTESTADRALTEHLVKSLQLLNIRLLDHLIVAGSRAVSFAEKGFL